MKIVLRTDVDGVGRKGDVRDVADGYARNFLLPKGMAMVATPGIAAQAEAMRRARAMRHAAERDEAQTVADILRTSSLRVPAKAGKEGKLFGSVTSADIADALRDQAGATVDRRQVELDDPIKSVGSHTVTVRLHPEVVADVTVEVVAQ